MARFRLTAPHFVTNRIGTAMYLEAGAEIDSDGMPAHWEPTPAMIPLDDDADRRYSDVVRRAIAGARAPEIVGYGHVRNMHRGSEHIDAVAMREKRANGHGEK